MSYGSGTSPRARGKLRIAPMKSRDKRNIPACAGKTHRHEYRRWGFPEHPRVRGENTGEMMQSLSQRGTSPRARGKLLKKAITRENVRNIPACAGKTSMVGVSGAWVTEHPRVRGENRPEHMATVTSEGTSPRARGKQHLLRNRFVQPRNIPACAGKTTLCASLFPINLGTSPRARGKPGPRAHEYRGVRNIPACAGKTL